MPSKHELTAADILPWAEYAKARAEHRSRVSAIKRNRRVEVGPHVTFYFESFDTMWLQVQEMLHIEKGGAEQLKDELAAYNPLIPKGRELVATFMIEIDDAAAPRPRAGGARRHRGDRVFPAWGFENPGAAGGRSRPHHGRGQGEFGAIRALPVHAKRRSPPSASPARR